MESKESSAHTRFLITGAADDIVEQVNGMKSPRAMKVETHSGEDNRGRLIHLFVGRTNSSTALEKSHIYKILSFYITNSFDIANKRCSTSLAVNKKKASLCFWHRSKFVKTSSNLIHMSTL